MPTRQVMVALLCSVPILPLSALSGGGAFAQAVEESIAETVTPESGDGGGWAGSGAVEADTGTGGSVAVSGGPETSTEAVESAATVTETSEPALVIPTVAPTIAPIETLEGVPDEVVVALSTSISTVISHIQTGNTGNDAIDLIADLAVADTKLGMAATEASQLRQVDLRFDALESRVAQAGFKSIEEYLVIRKSGILTEREMAAIDPLIKAVGGTRPDGVSLVRTRPRDADIERAREFLADAKGDVARAERAIAKALEKDANLKAVLAAFRGKLAPYHSKIAAAVN